MTITLADALPGDDVQLCSLAPEADRLRTLGLFPGARLHILTVTRIGVTLRTAGVTFALSRRTAGMLRCRYVG